MNILVAAVSQVIIVFVSLAFLLLIPGYLTLSAAGLIAKSTDKSRGKELASVVFFSVLISVLLSSWWGITLAELQALSLLTHLVGVVAFSLALALVAARRHRPALRLPAPAKEDLALVGIVAIAALLFWPPGQPIFGTHDAGAHFGAGINLGRTGGFLIQDSALMAAMQNANLFQLPLGLMSANQQQGVFVAQFSGLYEVWIALFFLIFGWWSPAETLPALVELGKIRHPVTVPVVFYVTPLFGMLGVASVYSSARAVYSRRVGLLAALFLTVSLPQVWYSRLAMSEVLAQFLIFGGIAAYVHSLAGHRRLFYFLAGTAFGLASLVRIDAVFVYIPFGLWLLGLMAFRRWSKDHLYLFGPLALLALQNATLYAMFSHDYLIDTANSLAQTYGHLPYYLMGIALAVTLLVGYLWATPSASNRLASWAGKAPFSAPVLLTTLVALLAIYAYFVRPLDAAPAARLHQLMEQEVVYDDNANLVKLGWYLSPLGIALGIAGMSWTVARRLSRKTWLLLAMSATYGLIFMHNAYITPHHPFWVRRYLIVFIPSLLIFSAAVLLKWGKDKWTGRLPAAARLVGCGALLVGLTLVMPRAIAAPQYQESTQQLQGFAKLMPRGGAVIFERSEAAKWLALPLTLLYGQSTSILAADSPDMENVGKALGEWWAQGMDTYYVSHIGALTINDDRLEFQPLGRAQLEFRQLEMTFGKLPEENQLVLLDVDVYRLSARNGSKPLPSYPFELRLGDMDYGYIVAGFFRPEGSPSAMYRHTNGSAELKLPWNPSGKEVVLSLTAAAARPSGAAPATTTVYVEGSRVGDFTLPSAHSNEGEPYVEREVRVDVDTLGRQSRFVSVRLESNPWKPVEYGLEDTRSLGIAIRRIGLRDE